MLCSRLLKAIGHRGSSPTPGSPARQPGWGGAVREGSESNEDAGRMPAPPADRGKWWQASERVYDWLVGGYRWTLQLVLEHRALTMLICGVLFLVTIALFYVIPKGFIPNDDTSRIVGYTEAAEGISFEEMSRHQQQIVDIIRTKFPPPLPCSQRCDWCRRSE